MKINEQTGKIIFSGLLMGSVLLAGYNLLYSKKQEKDVQFEVIKQYLVNQSSLAKSGKPILWIHNEYKINDRNWKSFGSRNSNELNKPIIYLTIHSIIQKCDKSFNICIIDDNSFGNLIPGWNINMDTVPEPTKAYYRQVAFLHLLHTYGGMIVPSGFLCFHNLAELYEDHIAKQSFFITEVPPTSILTDSTISFPSFKIMGCNKDNKQIHELLELLEKQATTKFTNETNFTGNREKILYEFASEGKCKLVSGKVFGYYDEDGNAITQDELMSDEPIVLSDKNVGIEIPIDNIITRNKQNWLATLNLDDLPKVQNNIGHLLRKIYC